MRFDKIELAGFHSVRDPPRMNLSIQKRSEGWDRPEPVQHDQKLLHPSALNQLMWIDHVFRLPATFRIPVGYQDKTGFHHGDPQDQKIALVFETGDFETDAYQF